MAPLADAVRLVHGESLHLEARYRLQKAWATEPLGCDVEEVQLTPLGSEQSSLTLRSADRRVHEARPDPLLTQGVHLVLHEGDERAHDQGQARKDDGRELVDQ